MPIEEGGLMSSYESACDLYRGDPTAIRRVGLGVVTRAFFIGAGLALAGMRDERDLFVYSIAGSLGVEAFVIGWVWKNSPKGFPLHPKASR